MSTLLSLKFWFSVYPGQLSPIAIIIFAVLVGFFILLYFITKIMIARSGERLHRRLYRKFTTLIVTDISLIIVLFFLMYEAVPFLGSRFWFLLLILLNLVWLFFIYRFYKEIPGKKELLTKTKEFEKYLP